MTHPFMKTDKGSIIGWQMAASGIGAVWATENTGAAIFDAMQRKEVYATTGPRIRVRLFGGWDFTPEDINSRMLAGIGYQRGVPMGGDLRRRPKDAKAPSFQVTGMRLTVNAHKPDRDRWLHLPVTAHPPFLVSSKSLWSLSRAPR